MMCANQRWAAPWLWGTLLTVVILATGADDAATLVTRWVLKDNIIVPHKHTGDDARLWQEWGEKVQAIAPKHVQAHTSSSGSKSLPSKSLEGTDVATQILSAQMKATLDTVVRERFAPSCHEHAEANSDSLDCMGSSLHEIPGPVTAASKLHIGTTFSPTTSATGPPVTDSTLGTTKQASPPSSNISPSSASNQFSAQQKQLEIVTPPVLHNDPNAANFCPLVSSKSTIDALPGVVDRLNLRPIQEQNVHSAFESKPHVGSDAATKLRLELLHVRQLAKRSKGVPTVELVYGAGQYQRLRGNSSWAVECFRQALALQPTHRPTTLALAHLLLVQGYYESAITLLTNLVEKTLELHSDPMHFKSRCALGLAFEKQGNFPAAIRLYEQVLSSKPGHVVAVRNIKRCRESLRARDQLKSIVATTLLIVLCIGITLWLLRRFLSNPAPSPQPIGDSL
eukprot:m.361135 g.361135  ORF g.361135 m.361135 type:complete len:453 (-) comp19347_c0_seq1:402-1760(-)